MAAAASTNSLLLQDGGRPGVGRDADILEEHAAEKEVHVVGEGVELGQPRSLGGGGEASLEIDRRPADGLAAESLAIEPDMGELVLGQFVGELPDGLVLELHLVSAFDAARF